MFGGGSTNPYDDIVAKTTDENLTSENWELILNLCDKVTDEGESGAHDVVASLLKRLSHRNANVQLYTLTLAEALSKNCGIEVSRELASRAFTSGLEKLVTDRTTHAKVRSRTLALIAQWTDEFRDDPTLGVMEDCLQALEAKNYHPPAPVSEPVPDIDDERRRQEEEELQRVLEISVQDKGGRNQWASYTSSYNQPASPAAGPSRRSPSPALHQHPAVAPTSTAPVISSTPIQTFSTANANTSQTSISSTATSPPNPSINRIVTRVRALHPFTPTEPGELAFQKDDIIKVVDRNYKDWWRGQLRGRTGIFPVNYVEVLPELSEEEVRKEMNEELRVFEEAVNVEKLLQMLKALERGEGVGGEPTERKELADDEEIQELYRRCMALRPKIVKLIDKYSQKRADLVSMNETFVRARTIFDRMMEESLARHTGVYDQPTYGSSPYGWAPPATQFPTPVPVPGGGGQYPGHGGGAYPTGAPNGNYPSVQGYAPTQGHPVQATPTPYPATNQQSGQQPSYGNQQQPAQQPQAYGGPPQQQPTYGGAPHQQQQQQQQQLPAYASVSGTTGPTAQAYPQPAQGQGQGYPPQTTSPQPQAQTPGVGPQPVGYGFTQPQTQYAAAGAGATSPPTQAQAQQYPVAGATSAPTQPQPQPQQYPITGATSAPTQPQSQQYPITGTGTPSQPQTSSPTATSPSQSAFPPSSQPPTSTPEGLISGSPPFPYDPYATTERQYVDDNVQAWANYYRKGGKEKAGAVYFIYVPGVSDPAGAGGVPPPTAASTVISGTVGGNPTEADHTQPQPQPQPQPHTGVYETEIGIDRNGSETSLTGSIPNPYAASPNPNQVASSTPSWVMPKQHPHVGGIVGIGPGGSIRPSSRGSTHSIPAVGTGVGVEGVVGRVGRMSLDG